jgi:hypothetical protein
MSDVLKSPLIRIALVLLVASVAFLIVAKVFLTPSNAHPPTTAVENWATLDFENTFHVTSRQLYGAACVLATNKGDTSTYNCGIYATEAGVMTKVADMVVSEAKISGTDYATKVVSLHVTKSLT